jgi:hypothetical protein
VRGVTTGFSGERLGAYLVSRQPARRCALGWLDLARLIEFIHSTLYLRHRLGHISGDLSGERTYLLPLGRQRAYLLAPIGCLQLRSFDWLALEQPLTACQGLFGDRFAGLLTQD